LALTEGVLKAMLLSKLKISACAAVLMILTGIGASGLTYRATAQTPRPKETLASQSQTDELEALRLEIVALRKSLQTTRERVKTLESEVSALKGQRNGPQGTGKGGSRGTQPSGPTSGIQGGQPGQRVGGLPQVGGPQASQPQPGMPQSMQPPGTQGAKMGSMMRKRTSDPVTDAENALMKLKENPGDKQATESLERALKQLKEREKQNLPAEGTPYQR
jgi:hypothetical protein